MNGQVLGKLSTTDSVPPALLFGCSSGFLKPDGQFDPRGIALEYLYSGSPAVLGNLWDVTDVDLDKFANELLHQAVFDQKMDLAEATCHSRDACQLKYLVGASPVLYGIPIHLCPV